MGYDIKITKKRQWKEHGKPVFDIWTDGMYYGSVGYISWNPVRGEYTFNARFETDINLFQLKKIYEYWNTKIKRGAK